MYRREGKLRAAGFVYCGDDQVERISVLAYVVKDEMVLVLVLVWVVGGGWWVTFSDARDVYSQVGSVVSKDWAHLPGAVFVTLVMQMEERNQYRELHTMLGVCRVWYEAVTGTLRHLTLNYSLSLSDLGAEFKGLETLDLSNLSVVGDLKGISTFGTLQTLRLNGALRQIFRSSRDEFLIRELTSVPTLSSLEGLVFRGSVPSRVVALTGLRHLSFYAFDEVLDPPGFTNLTALRDLQSLTLVNCQFRLGLLSLILHTKLTSLTLESCGSIPNGHIMPPPNLQQIVLKHTVAELSFLDHSEHLTKVDYIQHRLHHSLEGAPGIPQVPNLVHLRLHCAFDFDVAHIHMHMYHLTQLDVLRAHGVIESNILNHIEFPRLKKLAVCASFVPEESFQNLTNLTNLSSLVVNVREHRLSRYGAMCLMELTSLTRMLFYPNSESLDSECIRHLFLSLPMLRSPTIDYAEVIEEAQSAVKARSRELPVFLGVGSLGNSKNLDDSKIGGVALLLVGEVDLVCTQCHSNLTFLFQVNYGKMPGPLKTLFGDNLLQFFFCTKCPRSAQLRLIPREVRDQYGCKGFGEEHVLPWGGGSMKGIRPVGINHWRRWDHGCFAPSQGVARKVLQESDIDEATWRDVDYRAPSPSLQSFVVGGRSRIFTSEDLACPICKNQMSMVAASVRASNPVGNCAFLQPQNGCIVTVLCCDFHTDQMCFRFPSIPSHVLFWAQIVTCPGGGP